MFQGQLPPAGSLSGQPSGGSPCGASWTFSIRRLRTFASGDGEYNGGLPREGHFFPAEFTDALTGVPVPAGFLILPANRVCGE